MRFKLFARLAALEGVELYMLAGALLLLCLLILLAVRRGRGADRSTQERPGRTRLLVYGAMSLTLSFILSYMKLFSMPFGGSITLFSMLPLIVYAWAFGPAAGFLAGLAYSLLQMTQGVWVVHWLQFLLDYLVAFTLLGIAGFLPGSLPAAAAAAGFARMLCSTVSGAVFFADGGLEYGISNPWVYSLLYNGLTIGADTLLCVLAACLPPLRRTVGRLLKGRG